MNQDSADHINSGTISLTEGDLTVSQSGTTATFSTSGTIAIGADRTFALSGGALTNFSGGVLTGGTYDLAGTFRFDNASIASLAATVILDGAGAAIVDQSGTNALEDLGSIAQTGNLTLVHGRDFSASGAFSNAGTLDLGVGSLFTAPGDYTQASTGTVHVAIAGLIVGSDTGRLVVSGQAALDGTLNVSLAGNFLPAEGNTFSVATYGSRAGAFATIGGLDLGNGLLLEPSYTATDLTFLTKSAPGVEEATLSINDVTVSEGDAGPTNANFTITLSQVLGIDVTVVATTAAGLTDPATAGADYTTTSQTVRITAGNTTATFSVPIIRDLLDEANETFVVNLSSPTGATIADGQGIGTITDDDGPVSVTISGVGPQAEGTSEAGVTLFNFIVSLSGASGQVVTVLATTQDIEATAPGDYTAFTDQLVTFLPTETSKTVTVQVRQDDLQETDERFIVTLANATNATITGPTQVIGTITDDDFLSFSINNVTIIEGDSGTATATFTITLSSDPTAPVTVQFAIADDSATVGSDYQAASGTLTFNPGGALTQTIDVPIVGDLEVEETKRFFVNLSDATGEASISDAQGIGTILDNDSPTLSINDVTVAEGNSGTVNAQFTVSLSQASVVPVTVQVARANGTVAEPGDYTAVPLTTLTFNPGESLTQTVSVAVNGDVIDEVNETFFVNLSSPNGATIADGQGQGTITDDDALPVVTISDVTKAEGTSLTLTDFVFFVMLSQQSGKIVTVDVATRDGQAIAGVDYTAVPLTTVTFNPGDTSKQVVVQVNADDLDESVTETFFVDLSNQVNATRTGLGNGVIQDNDARNFTITSPALITEGDSGTTTATFTVTLSSPTTFTNATVNFTTTPPAGGAIATPDVDYQSTSGTLVFGPTETTKQVLVTIIGDQLDESLELFFVDLNTAVNAGIIDARAQGFITDDDASPVLTAPTLVNLQENTVSVGTVSATDADGDTVNFTVSGTDAAYFGFSGTGNSRTLVFNAPPNFEAPQDDGQNNVYNVTVLVNDGNGNSDSHAVTVTVVNVNDAPVLGAIGNRTVQVGATLSFTVTATDADVPANILTLSSSTLPTGATFNTSTGAFSWMPTAGQVGDTSLTITVTDNGSPVLSDSETITISVTAEANHAPVVNDQLFSIAENSLNGTVVGKIVATDPNVGQTLTYALTGTAFAVNTTTGQITVADSALLNFETTPSFILTATVMDNGSPILNDTAVITINLTNGNEAPVVNSATFTLAENSLVATAVGTVTATDPDAGQTLTFSITSGNVNGALQINGTTGAISVANSAALNFETMPQFVLTVLALDNGVSALSGANTITINLTDVNEAPTLTAPAAVSVPENTTTVATVTANDPDAGTTLTFSLSGADAAKFQLTGTGSTRTLSFVNAPDFEMPTDVGGNNVYDVRVTVSDGTLSESKSIAVSVTVTDVNEGGQAPYIIQGTNKSDKITVKESDKGWLTVTVNDKTSRVQLQQGQELQVLGLGGNDHIMVEGLNRNALIDGGDGNDKIDGHNVTSASVSLTLLGGQGNDRLIGGLGNDVLVGGPGLDTLTGGGGHDVLKQDDDGGKDHHDWDSGHDRINDRDGCQPGTPVNCSNPWVKEFVGKH